MYVHGIPYIATFTIIWNTVVDSNYSMLLGRPWLRIAKIAHDWGNNMITVQGNGTIQTIAMIKHLDTNLKRLEVFSNRSKIFFQVFNGMVQFYKCFIKNFTFIMAPITKFMKKMKQFL
jgi:hypothetical protein